MNASWHIDDIDCDKSMVRLRNKDTNLAKSYYFSKLKQAKLNGLKLIAHCEDSVWELDILTSVRRRINAQISFESENSLVNTLNCPDNHDIPYFLRKK
jgi:hypothetical protein